MSITLTIGHHLWMSWLQIASEREKAAHRARTRGLELPGGGDALAQEMHASMVAISGAAHAIDALYGEIKPLVPVPAYGHVGGEPHSATRAHLRDAQAWLHVR